MKTRREKNSNKYSQDRFTALSAHQLRTPITTIQWSLDEVLSGKLGEINQRQESKLRDAYVGSRLLGQTISDLLMVAEIDSGALTLNTQLVDISGILKEVIDSEKEFAQAVNVSVSLVCNKSKKIEVDPTRFRKVSKSIIQNALTYSKSPGKIKVSVKYQNRGVTITFYDNGIGIPKKDIDKIFDKFYRSKNATKRKANGLGIKLYIAKKLIEAHGGSIKCESSKEIGTIFTITLKNKIPTAVQTSSAGMVSTGQVMSEQEKQFLNITVHELRSPLNNIQWTLEALSPRLEGILDTDEYASIKTIKSQTSRMLRLVSDLLDVGKLQEGKFSLEIKSLKLNAVVKGLIDEFQVAANKKNISLKYKQSLTARRAKIKGDQERLQQVLSNLLSNAVKYTENSGIVKVSYSIVSGKHLEQTNEKLVNRSINISNTRKKYAVIEVADSGMGISKIDQKKIFGRFFRTKKVLQSNTEGTGLGLFISKTIVDAHGGTMWLTSIPNQGTSFFIAFPVSK